MDLPPRQIQNISSLATPAAVPATVPGQLENQQINRAAPPPAQPADFLVDLISSLLVSRADAASILASVASRIAMSSNSVGEPGVQPGTTQSGSVAPKYARLVSMQNALSQWHAWAAGRRRLREISRSISSRNHPQSASQPVMPALKPGLPPFPSPPTVKVLGERSREERDAKLRVDALSLSPSSCSHSARPVHTTSPPTLITADSIPTEFQQSPSYAIVGRVLRAHLDLTHRDWRSRAFYEPSAIAAYHRWSDPAGQPHRDAADALADLSDPDVLAVPPELRSSDPDVSAEAWDHYRRVLAAALDRAFTSGVDWLRALRAMDLIYSNPEHGHPRVSQYISSALTDRVLLRRPLLHAEVIRFKLDTSFSDGSPLYSKESYIADWERATSRLPGEDVVTLATRITEAYLKKVNDPKVDAITVWTSGYHAREISARFTTCILADPVTLERGSATNYEFERLWGCINERLQRGAAHPHELNIITIAETQLRHHEAAAAGKLYDLSDIDDGASVASNSFPNASTGSRRTRRGQRRRAHANLPEGTQLLVVHE
jgi:hypothetical protein